MIYIIVPIFIVLIVWLEVSPLLDKKESNHKIPHMLEENYPTYNQGSLPISSVSGSANSTFTL